MIPDLPRHPELQALLEKAAQNVMTPEERFEQMVSFAYGQGMDSSPGATMKEVRERVRQSLPRAPISREEFEAGLDVLWFRYCVMRQREDETEEFAKLRLELSIVWALQAMGLKVEGH